MCAHSLPSLSPFIRISRAKTQHNTTHIHKHACSHKHKPDRNTSSFIIWPAYVPLSLFLTSSDKKRTG